MAAKEREGLSLTLDALTARIANAPTQAERTALRYAKQRANEAAMWIAEADAICGKPGVGTTEAFLKTE